MFPLVIRQIYISDVTIDTYILNHVNNHSHLLRIITKNIIFSSFKPNFRSHLDI